MCASTCTGYYLTQNFTGSAALLPPLPPENLEEMWKSNGKQLRAVGHDLNLRLCVRQLHGTGFAA